MQTLDRDSLYSLRAGNAVGTAVVIMFLLILALACALVATW